jgi:excisionase family DNA binding protein
MLTTKEVAEILGASVSSVRVWLNNEGDRRFPGARKFGRDWLIPESDLKGQPRGRKRGRPKKPAKKGGAAK